MVCPKCGSDKVVINTSTYSKSQSRSLLWNLFMLFITCGLWLVWMLIRKKKESVVKETIATCQHCGHTWKPEKEDEKTFTWQRDKFKEVSSTELSNNIKNEQNNAIDELTKLNALHNSGILSDDLFNQRKDALLRILENDNANIIDYNLKVIRENKRPLGCVKADVVVDGKQLSSDTEDVLLANLPEGRHSIQIVRGYSAVKSNIVTVYIRYDKQTVLSFKEGQFKYTLQIIKD